MFTAHPQREALHNEVHARPYERLTAPLALSHIALVGPQAQATRAHIAVLLHNRHLPLPAEDSNHLRMRSSTVSQASCKGPMGIVNRYGMTLLSN